MRPAIRTWSTWLPAIALLALCVGSLEVWARTGDYLDDAGPPLDALASGNLHRFLVLQPLMGPVSVLVRLPFVAGARLAGAGELARYRAGAFPCLVAAAVLGLVLVRLRGLRPNRAVLVLVLAVVTPASLAAVRFGHPEEVLGGVLCVAAVLLADRHPLWAGVALGLAVATKQWAIVAVAPVVLAAPAGRRLRLLAVALGVGELLTLPLFLGNSSAFTHITNEAASATQVTTSTASVWWLACLHPDRFVEGPATITLYPIPAAIAELSHPLIVALPVVLGFVAWRRGGDPLALLALALLLRCALDPVDNEYYHAPFLIALLAFETLRRTRLPEVPVLTLVAAGGLWLTFALEAHHASARLANTVYLAWVAAVALSLLPAAGLFPRLSRRRWLRSPAPAL